MKPLWTTLLLAAAYSAAQTLPQGVTRVATVEGITEYRLDNGLRALLFPDQSKPTITVNIAYLTGSRHESYGETGMAHIIEHLVSYGSTRHPDAKKEQSDRGAQRNATTGFDRTTYFEIFPSSDENLSWALDLEADRMRTAPVRKDILDSQMSVVRNEYEAGENSTVGVLFKRIFATAFAEHNYSHTPIGARSDIEGVPIERLKAFYDMYYQPDNAVLVVAGKFDPARAISLVAEKFGPIPKPSRPLPPTYTREPVQDGERSVTLRRVGDTQALVAAYHIVAGSHPDIGPLSVLVNALTGNPHGRLYKALVESRKAASVSGGAMQLQEPGLASFQAVVRKEASLDEARDVMVKTIDGLLSEPATADEVDRAKQQLLKNIELSLNDSTQVGLALTEAAASGDWRLLFLRRDWIRKTTAPDVSRVARAYLLPSNRTLGLFVPEEKPARASIPEAPYVASLVRDYKGDEVAEGESFDPSPANIDSRTVRSTLAGGMKLALLSKRTRGGTVHAVLRLNLGDEQSLTGRSEAASAAAQMLMRGTTKRNRQQIQSDLDRLKAQGNVSGSAEFAEVSITTVRANFAEALRIAAEVLREPVFPANEFELLKQSRLAQAENQRSEPQARALNAMARHYGAQYPPEDPRYVPSVEESIERIRTSTLDQAREFHSAHYGASNAEFAAVGDFDAPEVQKLIEELFGTWKSPRTYKRIARPYRKLEAVNRSIETPDKANAVLFAAMPLAMSDEHADYPALLLANYLLGGTSVSRLYLRIRGKEGLSYGVGSQVQASPQEENGQFVTFAISNPQNTSKVETALKEEMERALQSGFTAEEVAAGKKSWLQSQTVNRSQDASLVRQLRQGAYLGRTMAFTADTERKIGALTAEDLAAALRRHIVPSQLSYFKAGDFKKAGGGD